MKRRHGIRDPAKQSGLIDILDMLKTKCRHETPEEILKMVDGAVMDLQLNYMDEVKKSKDAEETAEESAEESAPEDSNSDGAEG